MIQIRDNDSSKTINITKCNLPISDKTFYKGKLVSETLYYSEDNKLFVGITKDSEGKIREQFIKEYIKGKLIKTFYIGNNGGSCSYYIILPQIQTTG